MKNKITSSNLNKEYWARKINSLEKVVQSNQEEVGITEKLRINAAEALYFNQLSESNLYAQTTLILTIYNCLLKRYFLDFKGVVSLNNILRTRNNKLPFLLCISDINISQEFGDCLNLVREEVEQVLNHATIEKDTTKKSKSDFQNLHDYSLFGLSINSKNLICKGLTLKVNFKRDDSIELMFEFNQSFVDNHTALHLLENLKKIVIGLKNNINNSISDFSILDSKEEEQILYDFNNTKKRYPDDKTIIDLFEQQVLRTPENLAVLFKKKGLTYSELNKKVNQLAHYLVSKCGIQKYDIIGVLLGKSENALISVLAILKTGAAYLPIDLRYPKDRITHILDESKLKFLMVDNRLEGLDMEEFIIDLSTINFGKEASENLNKVISPRDLAYVVYTSGSTGNPKGVMIEHTSNVNMSLEQIKIFDITEKDKIVWFASMAFDASISEMMMALFSGATLLIPMEEAIKDKDDFVLFLEEMKPSVVTFPPSYLDLIEIPEISELRCIISAGEVAHPTKAMEVLTRKIRFFNAYGPSECSVCATTYEVKENEQFETTIPIGEPIANLSIYITDEFMNLVPIGAIGEICISGVGLARGYLNQPKLTATKFVPSPFFDDELIYKTGDLGRWLSNGTIVFMGRKDRQVKIRGYRIELGEIENVLLSQKEVLQVAVLVRNNNNFNELTAYIVGEGNLDIERIKTLLAKQLPEYMLPDSFVEIDTLPFTPNGKVDAKALIGLEPNRLSSKQPVLPRNQIEKKLVAAWQEILGVNHIGITDDFFELGGHSLKAIRLSNKIRQQLGFQIHIKDLFKYPTIAEMAVQLQPFAYQTIPLATISDDYPVSSAQKRLWTLSQMEGGNLAYNISGIYELHGAIDIKKLEQAFKKVIKRHESLRTAFRESEQGELRQYIVPEDMLVFNLDVHNPKAKNIEEEIISNHFLHTFDLSFAPLVKVSIICRSKTDYLLLFNLHHTIGDGWSMEVLSNEVSLFYNGLLAGEILKLPTLPIQYKDYVVWLKENQQQSKLEESKQYWLSQFGGDLPILKLPSYKTRPRVKTYNGAIIHHKFSKQFSKKLRHFVNQEGATMFMVIMTGINGLFYRYTGSTDIILGTPVAGRNHIDLEQQIGLYLNTLAIRTKFNKTHSFLDLLSIQKSLLLDAYSHQDYPFDMLVSDLEFQRDTSRSALFDVMIVLQNQQDILNLRETKLTGASIKPHKEQTTSTSQFDISFSFVSKQEEIDVEIEYNTDIYDELFISRLAQHIESFMISGLLYPNSIISELDYLSEKEKNELLIDFNKTEVSYPTDKTIIELFNEQVITTPNHTAIVFEDKKLTYNELNLKSNQIANYLREVYAVNPNDLIGIKLDRSEQLIISILGVLKSGAAYVPIDINYPQRRIDYIQEDSESKLIIDKKELERFYSSKYSSTNGKIPYLGNMNHLAYVIYTSGTTGNPKGVMVSNGNIVNLIYWFSDLFHITPSTISVHLTDFSFDSSLEDIFGTLTNGGTHHIISKETLLDISELREYIEEHQINIINCVPNYVYNLLAEKPRLESVKTVIVGGDKLSNHAKNVILDIGYELYNHYGTTETTVDSFSSKITELPVNVGKPIDNTFAYVLGEDLELLPVGVIGTLFISGLGVSKGYLKREALTKEKFLENPFVNGFKMYNTGDLARWLPNGELEYIGRNDNQVKVRGYRIELGEIESHLEFLPEVEQSVVLVKKDKNNNKRIVAYLVMSKAFGKKHIINSLKQKLPEYMIPDVFLVLETFFLDDNGKVNRKLLPEPEDSDLFHENYVEPKSSIEKQLVNIWKDLLNIGKVGTYDNFFELGGDSIVAIQMISKAKNIGINIKVKDVFTYQTIYELANQLRTETKVISEQGEVQGEMGLLPIHHNFFSNHYADYNHFNQSLLLDVSKKMDDQTLKCAIQNLVFQHDSLRLNYQKDECFYRGSYGPAITHLKIETIEEHEDVPSKVVRICEDYQKEISIENGEIAKFVFIKTNPTQLYNRLFIVIHHLAIDGVSWRILIEDLSTYVTEIMQSKSILNRPKTTSYQFWQKKIQEYADSKELLQEIPYWETVLSNNYDLPQDFNYGGTTTYLQTYHRTIFFNETETKSVLQESNHAFGTNINDLLLSALALTICEWTQKKEVLIGLESHGREELFDDCNLNKTTGWFTSLFPVCFSVDQENITSSIIKVKETLRGVPRSGIGYGVLRYLSSNASIKTKLTQDIEQIIFNYLGQFDYETKNEWFSEATEGTGTDINLDYYNPSKIQLNGKVSGGRLQFIWSYDTQRYKSKTIKKLANRFRNNLLEIVKTCKTIEGRVHTPYDYGLNGSATIEQLASFKMGEHPYPIEDIYRLSPLQEGLLFHSLYSNKSNAYVMHMSFDLVGKLNINVFKDSWKYLSEKYSVLRTSFFHEEFDCAIQCVYTSADIPIAIFDYSDIDARQMEKNLSDFLAKDGYEYFDLKKSPLFKLTLIYLPEGQTRVIFTNHHIIFDGWSLPILFNEFLYAYQKIENNEISSLKIEKDNYKDYINYLSSRKSSNTISYWKDYLKKLNEASLLPFASLGKETNMVFGNSNVLLEKDKEFLDKLTDFTKNRHITLNTVFQGVWAYLLSIYTDNATTVFGTVISGRPSEVPNIEARIGLYINTIPLCTSIDKKVNIIDWLISIQNSHTISREEYGHTSLMEIQNNCNLTGELFDSIMVFENYPKPNKVLKKSSLLMQNLKGDEHTNYTMTIAINNSDSTLSIDFKFNSELISKPTIEMICGHFNTVLESMLKVKTVEEIEYITVKERQELLMGSNGLELPYPKDETVIGLFEKQVRQNPNDIAVVFENQQLTYKKLDEESNRLAHYLLDLGTEKDELIPICLDRSLELIIGILGILKAGGAYVPIDMNNPKYRIDRILEDTSAKTILSLSTLKQKFFTNKSSAVVLLDEKKYIQHQISRPKISLNPKNTVYVIYTSGSIGTPKGVAVPHTNLVNFITFYALKKQHTSLTCNHTFDVSVLEIFSSLLSGSTLFIPLTETVISPREYAIFLHKNRVSHCYIHPMHLEEIASELQDFNEIYLNRILIGVESIKAQSVRWYIKRGIRVVNGYGPTETTICATYYEVKDTKDIVSPNIPIGRPLPNYKVYILHESSDRLQPPGVVGELCISGAGLAKGYFNDDGLTKKRFVENPFIQGEKMYRTGDLAKWLPDGNIEFIGRGDTQIKVRGHRIELGEIEHAIMQLEGVKKAVVLTKEFKRKNTIIAYVIFEKYQVTAKELRDQLGNFLPNYMVPSHYVKVESIPLTPNGKIDRKALPEPQDVDLAFETYIAPKTKEEKQLASIWSDFLGTEEIGAHDNFFALGGDSLLAIRIMTSINSMYNIELNVSSIFKYPTINQLANFLVILLDDPAMDEEEYDITFL